MTVVRSLAFQNARKSTGQSTYYRRKGVQLVRSKPTFAPGRTFTQRQINAQQAVAAAKLLIDKYKMMQFVDICNVQHKKRYNASTQYNKLVANLINDSKEQINMDNSTAQEILDDYGTVLISDFCKGSIGRPPLQFAYGPLDEPDSRELYFYVQINKTVIDDMLMRANRIARPRVPFTIKNIGICGAGDFYRAPGFLPMCIPPYITSGPSENPTDKTKYDFEFATYLLMDGKFANGDTLSGAFVLFVYSEAKTGELATGGRSIITTDSMWFEDLAEETYQELPI